MWMHENQSQLQCTFDSKWYRFTVAANLFTSTVEYVNDVYSRRNDTRQHMANNNFSFIPTERGGEVSVAYD
jgi:hypothetical protein